MTEGLVGPSLQQFIKSHPDVECVLKSGDHETIIGHLWDGIVELGVIVWPCSDTFAAHFQPLLFLEEPVVLAANPEHPLAARKRIVSEDIIKLGSPLLLLRWWQDHHPELLHLVQRSGVHIEIPKEAARHLVLSGVGVGFFTRTFIASDLQRGTLVELKVQGLSRLSRTSALVSRDQASSLSPAALSFVRAVKKQAELLKLPQRSSSLET